MGQKIKIENLTTSEIELQIELAGEVKKVRPSSEVLIDTDFDDSEEIHIQLKDRRLVVWGGVAARIVDQSADE